MNIKIESDQIRFQNIEKYRAKKLC